MPTEYLDEATHVSPFEVMWQVNGHRQASNGVLLLVITVKDSDWIGKIGDTNLVDRYTPLIVSVLDVFHGYSSSPR